MDPNKQVIETDEQPTQEVVTEDNSSQSETTETQAEETQAEGTGEQVEETGEQTETAETEEGADGKPPKEDAAGKSKETAEQKRENEFQYWKRQAEKREKEVIELQQKLGADEKQKQLVYQQQQQQIDQLYAQAAEYQQAGDFQTAMQLTRQAATAEAEMRVNQRLAPLQQTYYKTQYENFKRELANDPEIISFKDIESDLDGVAKAFEISQPIALTSKEAIKNWALMIQGKRTAQLLKAAKEDIQNRKQTNKKIIGEATIPGANSAGAGNAGYTAEDKQWAMQHFGKTDTPSLEFAHNLRIKREKAGKEREKSNLKK